MSGRQPGPASRMIACPVAQPTCPVASCHRVDALCSPVGRSVARLDRTPAFDPRRCVDSDGDLTSYAGKAGLRIGAIWASSGIESRPSRTSIAEAQKVLCHRRRWS